ncbi:restriction endonuclease subunit S [Methylophilus sp. Leaf414]|uniref:restriction endonuclease subunit S n=1 Tax=Methylophilus sp. Leaf414 TaxID=1736371 RepID=UPI0006FAF435|nr:restriction endonuclease subunit S [Methylophilus sp. Leaf414]KQT33274.1 restriction endonuclease subunit S [Methylophilus sp. Leaf414]
MQHRTLLQHLGFTPKENVTGIFYKKYSSAGGYVIEVDFTQEKINYGDLVVCENKTTQNFSQAENWVILECVNRLLEKGYQPKNIKLEKTWATGHGTSGRLDIFVTHDDGSAYMMIECKTYGSEFDKEFKKILVSGGQLFTYFQQDKHADVLMLYASELNNKNVLIYRNEIIKIEEDYRETSNVKDFHDRWSKLSKNNGVFDNWVKPYDFQSKALTPKNLKDITQDDSGFIFNQFLEILRHNVVSDKPNAFNKIFTLFLCKIYDEKTTKPSDELAFQWFYTPYKYEGISYPPDDNISFQKRLTDLYKKGMKAFLEKDVTDISDAEFEKKYAALDEKVRGLVLNELTEIRLKKNNEFAIKEVFDDDSFNENAKVVKEVVELLQGFKIRYTKKQQYLSDFFELLLTTGLKQESGQFFTPVPIAQFIIKSLPLDKIVEAKLNAGEKDSLLPTIIDYAAGSGHFITESMHEIQRIIDKTAPDDFIESTAKKIKNWKEDHFDWAFQYVYGIEKDYRLVKVGKVGCYLHGDGLAQVIHGDGLANFTNAIDYKGLLKKSDKDFPKENKQFDVLVSNPPYSVSAFKNNARKYYTESDFTLYDKLTDQSSEIECLFIERMQQLLKNGGLAGVILPSSILSNSGIYTATREIILQYFEIIAIAELGSNTFMATGTNTVVLFLRRRNNYDSINIRASVTKAVADCKDVTLNGIEKATSKYVEHVWDGITYTDYQSLLQRQPSQAVVQHEIYQEYLKLKSDKKPHESAWWDKVISLETEKLFYFVLAYPQKIVLIKTGEKNDEKQFLGYEFSNRRGDEGIHPTQRGKSIDECTRLFDTEVFNNPEKASTYVYQAFLGDFKTPIDESLSENITRFDLVDMLTFDRSVFEKTITTNIKKKVTIDTKWSLVKLGDVTQILNGGTPDTKNPAYWDGEINWATLVDTKHKYVHETLRKITKEGVKSCNAVLLPINTVIFSSRATIGDISIAKTEICTNQGYKNFVCDENKIHHEYLYYILKNQKNNIASLASGMTYPEISKSLISDYKIPLPPIEIQKKIINEIAKLEAKEQEIESAVAVLKLQIFRLVEGSCSGRISDLCVISNEKINTLQSPGEKFINIGLENIESDTGKLISKVQSLGKEILSVKNTFTKGDVLYGKLRPYLNKVAAVDFDGICSTDILVLKTANPKILKYILLSQGVLQQTRNLMSGINLPRIKPDTFLNIKISFPELERLSDIENQISSIEIEVNTLENQLTEIPGQIDSTLQKYLK